VDVPTRKIRYFIAVAEELHFSRAAARLHIAQQALSKQVRELEDAVGAQLLDRTTRRVTLTPAGHEFLSAARASLDALEAGVAAAQRAARGETGVLRVGFGIGAALELTDPIFAEFRSRYPNIELDLREYPLTVPSSGLSDGPGHDAWAEVALVRLPQSASGLAFEPLFVEPRVAGMRSDHPLAARPTVSVYELLGEPVTVAQTGDDAWHRFWTLDDYRGGRRPQTLSTISHTEEIEYIAAGKAITITVAGAARLTPRPGVSYLPIVDVPGCACAVGWRTGRVVPLVERFVAVATEVRDREHEIVRAIEHPFGVGT
jgi:DNA-binding transcriptional LysR family regulator